MKALRKHAVKHGIVRHITRSLLEAKVPSVRKRLPLSMLLVVEARTKERSFDFAPPFYIPLGSLIGPWKYYFDGKGFNPSPSSSSSNQADNTEFPGFLSTSISIIN